MKKLLALAAIFVVGLGSAIAYAATTTGTVSACATVTGASHTVNVDGSPVATVGGDVASQCVTTTYTVTPVTETVTAPSTTTTTPPPAGGTPGIGVLSESGNLGIVSSVDQYAQVVGGAWGADVASVVEKVPGVGLVYFNGTDVRQSFSTGVTYTDALNNGWLLKDSAGNYLVNSTYGSYCVDVGSSSYQNAWIANVESYLSSHVGVDGVFIDNVLYDPKGDCGAYPAKYPTTAAWSTAMVAFAKAVYGALHPLGYYVELNAGAYLAGDAAYNDGTSTVAWWKQVGPYADGLMNEYYDQLSSTMAVRSSAATWQGDFDSWQRLIGTAQAMGDDFAGLTKTSGLNTAVATYGKASFLLEWDGGGGVYDYTCGNSCDPTSASWTQNIGTPVGAKFAVGVGYERTYTKGTVLVNPSATSSQTFSVNGASYTLAPTTASILH